MTESERNPSEEKFHAKNEAQQDPQPLQDSISSGFALMVEATNLTWNMVIPIVGLVLLGHYLDKRTGSDFTWTLSLLVLGVIIAFMNLYELNAQQRLRLKEQEKNGAADQEEHDEEK